MGLSAYSGKDAAGSSFVTGLGLSTTADVERVRAISTIPFCVAVDRSVEELPRRSGTRVSEHAG